MTATTPVSISTESTQAWHAEAKLAAMNVDAQRASWVQSTYITYDTQILSAKENEKLINAGVELAKKAARYDKLDLPTGQWPYNVAVAPSGKIALTADNGNSGASDGSVDTVSVAMTRMAVRMTALLSFQRTASGACGATSSLRNA